MELLGSRFAASMVSLQVGGLSLDFYEGMKKMTNVDVKFRLHSIHQEMKIKIFFMEKSVNKTFP